MSVPDNAARLLDCSGEFALVTIPQVQSTCFGGAGNRKDIYDDDNISVPLAIVYSVNAIIYLALGIYGFRVLKADWALGNKTEEKSVL